MIAASEPVEFLPRGRQAVDEHPGPQKYHQTKQQSVITEPLLLHRMQNVNLSDDDAKREFWSIREICTDLNVENSKNKRYENDKNTTLDNSLLNNLETDLINSEEEIYVKGYTAVWSQGIPHGKSVLPRKCFTCDTPIKFAFFCHNNFILEERLNQPNKTTEKEISENFSAICLIDSTSIRVYCNNGEDYLSNLEFPVSNIWITKIGLLLEKEASNTIIQSHSISMPRFFSLTHPLHEMSPVLIKSATGLVSYLTETDYRVIFTSPANDFVLIFDNKIAKHFVAEIRKATEEEIQLVGCNNNSDGAASMHHTQRPGFSFAHNSMKSSSGFAKNSPTMFAKSNAGITSLYNSPLYKNSPQTLTQNSSLLNSKSYAQSTFARLQSSVASSVSVQDIRKIGLNQPPKPIIPEFCLEHIWTESLIGKDFCEIASTAFMHTDLIGQTYLCYLLPRSLKLYLVRLEKTNSEDKQIFGIISTIPAKDAIVLDKMKMIGVLDQNGTLILYTGAVVVSKVHIPGMIISNVPILNINPLTPVNVGSGDDSSLGFNFPRRSSLLPTIHDTQQFDDELHLLSPVQPLQPQYVIRSNSICTNLRDPAGNRLTLVYNNNKMIRINLPLLNDNHFVTKCIFALRQVLEKELCILLLIRWYGARNVPGTQDFSSEQEWEIFKNILSELLGRSISSNESNNNASVDESKKRRINNEDDEMSGTEDDWNFMNEILNGTQKIQNQSLIQHNDYNAPFYSQIPIIYYTLHLLYEDLKLDETMNKYLWPLAEFLHQLASDMGLKMYCLHYLLDFPQLKYFKGNSFFTVDELQKMKNKNVISEIVPNIFNQILYIIKSKETFKYSCIANVNTCSKNVIQLVSVILHGDKKIKSWIMNIELPGTISALSLKLKKRFISGNVSRWEQIIQMLINMEMSRKSIERLPPALHLIIAEALEHSRISPPNGYKYQSYELLLRPELVENARNQFENIHKTVSNKSNLSKENSLSTNQQLIPSILTKADTTVVVVDGGDGMENIDTKLLSLRYPEDLRINEVRRLLNSSKPVLIELLQSPGVSDHEFIEEQEKQLFAMCTRTMSLPMGRGMLTLRSSLPAPTESMPIPKLCLTGKEPTKGATIEMQQIEFPANMNLWPSFHNGVAAGLKISPNAKDIDSTWIVYNKPKQQSEVIPTEHAGFLMGLGLNGHLKNLSFMSVYEYLVKCDEMTSVGLLLGISATHRGTMDNTTTKLLSVHIEALLPATALELDIPQNIQVASLMGIGLIYQGTAKRHIAEVLLQEIGRPPGPEMENSVERESYALTAGLALGLVTLGQGEASAGLRDLQLPDILHYYMIGGNKRPLTGSQKEKYKLPSFQVREGETVNIDVTAPGATLALGLMFFNTENRAVAQWMMPPDTSYLLDLIRPDLLLLRIISKGLILWNEIQPEYEWLLDQFPSKLDFDLERGPGSKSNKIDHEANAQAYCNIIAGAGFCIGLKYAGTENIIAFRTLMKIIRTIINWSNGHYVSEFAGKATVESALILLSISLSLVFAGTGNIQILRLLRMLRSRTGAVYSQVTYGSQMGIHMALGFLFLGAGRYTLSRTPESIAALVCALFPKFPNHSNDNRYHLQAFRHLYIIAVEPRLFLPRDIDTGKLCLCYISYIEVDSNEIKKPAMAPCILPELNTLKYIEVDDTNYWPVCFERGRNWAQLEKILQNCECIDVKKRAGCLSYLEDPDRLKSLLAQTLTAEQYRCWKIESESLLAFSSNIRVVEFIEKFLEVKKKNISNSINNIELERSQLLIILFYNALTKDKMHTLPIYLSLLNYLEKIQQTQDPSMIWQFKILNAYHQEQLNHQTDDIFISKEIFGSILEKFKCLTEEWRLLYKNQLKEYLLTDNVMNLFENIPIDCLRKIIIIVRYYELRPNPNIALIENTYFKIMHNLKKMNYDDSETINCIIKLLTS